MVLVSSLAGITLFTREHCGDWYETTICAPDSVVIESIRGRKSAAAPVIAPSTRLGISSAMNVSAGSEAADPPPWVSFPVCWMELSHMTATVPSPWLVADTPEVEETTPASGAGNI